MDRIQTALVIVGALALAEAVWGITSPGSLKRTVGWIVDVAGTTQGVLGAIFLVIALLFGVLVLLGQPLSSWVLLVLGLLFAAFGLVCFRPGALKKMLSLWILNRTLIFVRIIYFVELLAAIAILWVALAHK